MIVVSKSNCIADYSATIRNILKGADNFSSVDDRSYYRKVI